MVRNTVVTRARVAFRCANRKDRHAVQRSGSVCGIGGREPAVAERRARADDSRSDRAHDDVELLGGGVEESRRGLDALDVSVQTGADRDRRFDVARLAQRSQRVRERDR